MIRVRAAAAALAVVAAVASVAGSCGVPAVSSADEPNPSPGCNLLDGLDEKIVSTSLNDLGGAYPEVGDSVAYLDYLYDSSGKRIGTVYGTLSVIYRDEHDHLMNKAHETIRLPGGTLTAEGIFDLTKSIDGEWQFLPVIGTSGGYDEKLGRRSFQIITAGKSLHAKIELCPPGQPS